MTAPAPTKYPSSGRLRLGNTANRDPFVWQVSDGDKETYQTQVNEAMARYKQEYTDWYESLSPDEQKVNKWYLHFSSVGFFPNLATYGF